MVKIYKTIKIADLLKLDNPYIIDVREPCEYELGKIPRSINIPAGELLDNYERYLDINKKYYIYCKTSLRSIRVCEYLSDVGYDVYLIEGGYEEWLSYNKRG